MSVRPDISNRVALRLGRALIALDEANAIGEALTARVAALEQRLAELEPAPTGPPAEPSEPPDL